MWERIKRGKNMRIRGKKRKNRKRGRVEKERGGR
jgi:hypothetical protein